MKYLSQFLIVFFLHFSFMPFCQIPGNNNCSDASLLNIETCGFKDGTLLNATQELPPVICDGFTSTNAFDVWYKFTATSQHHNITVIPLPTLDVVVELRGGTCNSSFNIDCQDMGGGPGKAEVIKYHNFIVGQVYFVRIYAFPGAIPTSPKFDIYVTKGDPVSNDFCNGAINLTTNSSCINTVGTVGGATASGLPMLSQDICFVPTPHLEDVWFKFTANSNGLHTVTVTPPNCNTYNGFDPVIGIYTSCGGNEWISMDSGGGVGKSESISFSTLTGITYYIRVYDCGSLEPNISTFNICVTTQAVCTPVSVSVNPQSQTINSGGTATLNVSVSGTPPFSYYWYKNNIFTGVSTTNSSNATNSFTTPILFYPNDNGSSFYCIVKNCNETFQAQSQNAIININPPCPNPPANPPIPTKNNPNCGPVTLTRSNPPSGQTYYWQGNSCGMTTAFGSSLTFQANSSGQYYLRAYDNINACWSNNCSSVSVIINNGTSVSISPSSPTINVPDPFILTATDIPGATYTWTGNVGNPLPATSRILNLGASNLSMSGQYCVTATLNGCVSLPACVNVNITANESLLNIPVVFHVLYNEELFNVSNEKIDIALDNLNKDFQLRNSDKESILPYFLPLRANCRLNFVLAKQDRCGNATSGIIRKKTIKHSFYNDAKSSDAGGDDIWPPSQYLNIWVVPKIKDGNTCPGGFAPFASNFLNNPSIDGVVIQSSLVGLSNSQIGGRTLTHEVGHWLNLHHIWGDTDTGYHTCSDDDGVSDTPKQKGPTESCVSIANSPNNCDLIYGEDMYQNYMDYTFIYCEDIPGLFTLGQKAVIDQLFMPGGIRHSLTQSPALTPVANITINTLIGTNRVIGHPTLNNPSTFYCEHTHCHEMSAIKVCADGSTSSYFKVNVSGIANSSEINFQILDQNNNILADAQNPNLIIDNEKYGSFGIPYKINGTNVDIEVAYTHPTFINVNGMTLELKLRVLKNGSPNIKERVDFPLHIYRAPVLMVHGLWGDVSAFEFFEKTLIYRNLYPGQISNILGITEFKSNSLTHRLDYKSTNDVSFNENRGVLIRGRNELFDKTRKAMISCGKIIVIAHSMGGILSRKYLQAEYYKNDIQKLITINTPHYGSQMANYILWPDGHDGWPDNNTIRTALWIAKRNPFNGSIHDLKVNWYPINELNIEPTLQHKVPTRILSSKEDQNFLHSSGSCRIITSIAGKAFSVHNIFNEINDNIVAIRSQNSDLNNYNFSVNDQCHMGAADNLINIETLIQTINTSPNNLSIFKQDGFKPGVLEEPKPAANSFNVGLIPDIEYILTDSIKFSSPLNNQNFLAGTTVPIIIVASQSVSSILFAALGDKIPITINDSMTNHLIYNYKIPNNAFGEIRLIALGGDSISYFCLDTISIFVNSTASVDTIFCKPDTIRIPLGFSKSLNISGIFSDGIIRELTGNDSLIFVFDTTIVSVHDNQYIFGKSIGDTTISVKFKNKEALVFVSVYLDTSLFITSFSSDSRSICQGSTISYKNESTIKPEAIQWVFQGGEQLISNINNPVIKYLHPGIYNVIMQLVYPNKNDTLVAPNYVSVNPIPQIDIGSPKITSTCALTLNAQNFGSNFLWSNGDTTQTIEVLKSGTYLLTVTNEHGCSASASVEVEITDSELPQLKTKTTILYLDENGKANLTPNQIDDGTTDNCGLESIAAFPTEFNCHDLGQKMITFTATDVNGNTNSSQVQIQIKDNLAPRVICPTDLQLITKPGECSVLTSLVNFGSFQQITENCNLKYPHTNNATATLNPGVNSIKWTVSDIQGNKSTCTQKVTVTPYSCGKPTNLTTSNIASTSFKLNWLAGNCATAYKLRIRVKQTNGSYTAWSSWQTASGPGLTHQFSNLQAGKYYNYQLRTACGLANSGEVNGFIQLPNAGGGGLNQRNHIENEIDGTQASMEIFPNPAKELCLIRIFGFDDQFTKIRIFNAFGKLVATHHVQADENSFEFKLNELNISAGLYLVEVSDEKLSLAEKLIVLD